MRAAVLHELGVPRADDFAEPPEPGEGRAIVEVLAAGLNPVDVAICAGRFYAGAPPLPSVAGREGVGLLDGRRVYFDAPVLPYGSMAERVPIDAQSAYDVPDDVENGTAVALGISGLAAWLALTWRAQLQPGEHVLVLAASGVLGQIAVQAARSLGAARVVAAARSQEGLRHSLELGADATVTLDGGDDLAQRLARAGNDRIDVVVDPLFGEPFAAALNAASFGARIVQVGSGAGNESTVSSAAIRGKMLMVMGHTNFAAPPEIKRDAYASLSALAASGELEVESEPIELERVGEAWERLQAGAHRKIVLVPPGR
jgi:NADPH:quinone reductase-like Zn-dependent oxidoreductase